MSMSRALPTAFLAFGLAAASLAACARPAEAAGWSASNCAIGPITIAREQAHALFDKGDVDGAVARLDKLVSAEPDTLPGCLDVNGAAGRHATLKKSFSPDGSTESAADVLGATLSGRQAVAAEAHAWLLNDLALYMTDHRYGGQADGMACYGALSSLFDKDLDPLPWLTPGLVRASVTNLHACATICVAAECTIPRSAVWDRFDSQAKTFEAHRCAFAPGQQIDAATCVEVKPPKTPGPSSDPGLAESTVDQRKVCPTLALHRRGLAGAVATETLVLPDKSNLYAPSNCCIGFTLSVDPKTNDVLLGGAGQDCFGGTAHFAVEEIYSVDAQGQAHLVKNNSTAFH